MAWMRAAGRPESSIYQRGYHLRRFARETMLEPFAVTLEDLVQYLAGHDWGKSTRHAVRSTLRTFYRWARDTGRMSENPADRLPSVQPPLGHPRPAPEEAIEAGLEALDERVRLMVRLAASAGLRCAEIARVHTDDVFEDLEGWSLRVLGKGSRHRVVPLTRRLALELRALPHGYAFPGRIDGHLSAAYISKLVSRALPEGATAHMLRHRFASRAYSAQRDIRAVQELLGHSSVATTQVYTKVPDGALRAGVEAAA
jgi:integrase